MTTNNATYTEISRTIDPRDGALRVRVRPLNCSHDEHVVTVYREYAVDYDTPDQREWVEYNWGDDESEPAPSPLTETAWRYRAAIEDDILDADFVGTYPSVEQAVEHALEATCEFEEERDVKRKIYVCLICDTEYAHEFIVCAVCHTVNFAQTAREVVEEG